MSAPAKFPQEDLYLYTLYDSVTSSLLLLHFDESSSVVEPLKSPVPEKKQSLEGCSSCNVQFTELSPEEVKLHYKSDLHRLNLKRSVNALPPLTESEFDNLIETQSMESISGSEDSDSDEEEPMETIFEKLSTKEDEEEESTVSHLNTHSPFVLLKSPLLADNKALGFYKSLFSKNGLDSGDVMDEIKSLSLKKQGISVLLMIGGGHFAGAVISHTPKSTKGNAKNSKESRQEQLVNVLESKTFHRYTTRRKQGGSQSASDNARGKANSAGSSIRRYNEQALQKEVRELLESWKGYLQKAETVFIRANGASNRKILVGYEDAVLRNNDPRIRTFPFTTKRATLSEVKKAWVKLTYLSVVDIPKAKKAAERKEKKEAPPKTPEVEELSESDVHTKELITLMKKSKAPLVINYLKKNGLDVNFPLTPLNQHAHAPTLLHYAASQGLHHMVQILLINLKADPTVQNTLGRTAAQSSSTSAVRKAFQIARKSLGEDSCDWELAKVGPPKTKEELAKEEEGLKAQQQRENRRLIQEELAKKTEFETRKPTHSASGTLGGENILKNISETSGLTDLQKARLMREQRARAAEARMKGLQSS